MNKRSPILGYNHNFKHRGLVFHVQTEDSGVDNPHIFTHLFHGGVILSTRKLVYDAAASEEAVKSLMQAQHKAVLKDLKSGTFDEKIDSYLGDEPNLEPRKGGRAVGTSPSMEAVEDPSAAAEAEAATLSAQAARARAAAQVGEEEDDDDVSAVFRHIRSPGTPAPSVSEAVPQVLDESAEATTKMDQPPANMVPEPPTVPPAPTPRKGATPAGKGNTGSDSVSQTKSGTYRIIRRTGKLGNSPSPGGGNAPRGRVTGIPPVPPQGATGKSAGVIVSSPSVVVGAPPKAVGAPPKAAGEPASAAGRGPRSARGPRRAREEPRLFGKDLISEKSLDEVILAYLSEDGTEE